MHPLRTLALPLAVLSLSVVPVRADEPAPDQAPTPRRVAPDLPPPSGGGPAVRLVTRVIDVAPDVAARWRDPAHPAWRALTDAEATRLLARQKENVVSTSSSAVLPEQRATLEVLTNTSYISDYDVEISGMASNIANPIVKQVAAGTVLELTPIGSGSSLLLAVELQHTWIPPIRTERVGMASPALPEVTIQYPEIAGRTWQGDVSVPRGGHLLLLGAEGLPGANGTARLLLVTPTVVSEPPPGK
jgi:hypothetical protein